MFSRSHYQDGVPLQMSNEFGPDLEMTDRVRKLEQRIKEQEENLRELRARETAYRQLFARVPEAFLLVESESEHDVRFFGKNGELPSVENVSPRYLTDQVRRVFEEKRPVIYDEVQADENGNHLIHTILVPARDDSGEIRSVMGMVLKVAPDQATKRSLLEAEAIYQNLAELLPDAVLLTDKRGRFIYINPAGASLIGASHPGELIGRSVWDFVHPENRERARERTRLLRKGERVRLVEQRLVRMDGKAVPIETFSVPVRYRDQAAVISTARDLSGRKRMEEALSETRELFEKAFQLGPAAQGILRLNEETFVDVNDEFCHLTGYTRNELIGRTSAELGLFDTNRQRGLNVEPPGTLHGTEVQLWTKDGTARTVLISAQQVQIGGEPSLLVVLSDITERKRAERELIEAKEKAEEMARIKSAFLTNMTHEVRTPLTVILGFSSMLRQGVRPQYQRFVHVIERSGRRLLLMLDSILDLAQLEAGTIEVERKPFNISEVVRNVLTLQRPNAEDKGLSFALDLPGDAVYVREGQRLVTRVLNNLLDNAIKFTEKGSIVIKISSRDNTVYIDIEDTGIGIGEVFLPHIFDEFTQESTGLERTHQGSGLGLAVSKRLIELINGSLYVTSNKGTGSIFTVALPRAVGVNSVV